MNKKAKTKYGIHPLLENRWSPRAFREENVEKEKLQRIFEAAQWAPSSSNEQPWRFIVGEKGNETFDKIFAGLEESNQRWAKRAPVLILSMGRKFRKAHNREYFHYLYDTGQAVAHLTFQAAHEGLHVHQMAGFYSEIMRTNFHIPDEFTPATVIALGYIGKPEILDDDQIERELAERSRRDLKETLFFKEFGIPWE